MIQNNKASSAINPLAGLPAPADILVDLDKLVSAYYTEAPDPSNPLQRVVFGTSGHRGTSFEHTFNEAHVLAITQAICLYRKHQNIDGPLFIGIDTHALSAPAFRSALEVLAGNGVHVMLAMNGEYTPTPAVSLAILAYNSKHRSHLADGIVITPSHNPPDNGGFKYNPPNGGPAESDVTEWIEHSANEILLSGVQHVKRLAFEQALHAQTTHAYDFMDAYVRELGNIVDMDTIRGGSIHMGVDPLGGAGVHYWPAIAQQYKLDLTVVNSEVDATFGFMCVDWDGKIRMDPSSPYAMQSLIGMKSRYDIAFACDTDHDRHGIVTPDAGLVPPNHYLSAAIHYLFQNRPQWSKSAQIGKTVVSTQMINRVGQKLGHNIYEVPVGFKWFAAGLLNGTLGIGVEESAGASFLRRDGTVWTTDKDGLAPALLAAEITVKTGRSPSELYTMLTQELGPIFADRVQAPANARKRALLSKLSVQQLKSKTLADDPILSASTQAPGNDAAIGGLKVTTANGWFAARPSGTENIYKIYAESYHSKDHLGRILAQAQTIVDEALEA